MSTEIREQVTEWLTGKDTCYLLGAGCSAYANKPLIGQLTESVLDGLSDKLQGQFSNLTPIGDREPTIEDLINFLVGYRSILNSIKDAEAHDLNVDEIDTWLKEIKSRIVNQIADGWEPGEYHTRFLKRLSGSSYQTPRDIFSLNYDTLLEASLDHLRIPYADGFRGTNRAWFDPATFEETGPQKAYRIYKLHGSINWTRDDLGHVRRGRNANEDAEDEVIVVYPSEQKFLQTQFGVYETLISRFRDRLRQPGVNNHLIVLGYSFNDDHINEAIYDAINSPKSNLTVIAFVGPEQNRDAQNSRLTEFENRCDSRFNAFIGDLDGGSFIGDALDQAEANSVLDAGLWRFESLVDYIAGAGIV